MKGTRHGNADEPAGTHDLKAWLGWAPRFESLIRDASAPIYIRLAPHRLHSLGSAVFIALGERRFVATAAHVADDIMKGDAEIGFQDVVAPIHAQFLTTVLPPSGKRKDDTLDTAIAEVDPLELINKPIVAVPPRAFEISEDGYGEDLFVAAGYPHTEQDKYVVDGSLDCYLYRTVALARDAKPMDDLNRVVHLDLNFDRRRLFVGQRQFTGPCLKGMSGGGIWRVDEEDQRVRLAGILTEYDQGKRRIRSTRLWIILSALWHRFPELRHHIPESTIT